MTSKVLTIDIVIPQYKNTWLLKRCLTSLSEIDFPSNMVTIFVVENGGVFGAEGVIKEFEATLPVTYTYLKEGNLSKARNRGIELSSSDVIIFFDNDMQFHKDTLTSYVNAIALYGDKCFFGGALEPDYEEAPPQWLNPFLPDSAKGFSLGAEVTKHYKPDFLGGNHAVFRKHLLQVKGFDPYCASGDNEGAMGEETRLQQKLLKLGFTGIYVPNAKVKHYVPKKNCSKTWILKRAERAGITHALKNKEQNFREFFGVPIYHFKVLLLSLFNLIRFFWSTELRFKSKYKIRYQLGIISQYIKFNFRKNHTTQ